VNIILHMLSQLHLPIIFEGVLVWWCAELWMTKEKERWSNLPMEQAREIADKEACEAHLFLPLFLIVPSFVTTETFFLSDDFFLTNERKPPLNPRGLGQHWPVSTSATDIYEMPSCARNALKCETSACCVHLVALSLHQSNTFLFDLGNFSYMLQIFSCWLSIVLLRPCSKSQPNFG
jgi:hypothetical protein